MTYRALFCGGRDWSAVTPIAVKLRDVEEKHPGFVCVHGAGSGADSIAGAAAELLGIPCDVFPADWDREGRAAGPLRNQRMLASGIDAVYAFKLGFDRTMSRGGTEHMVKIALEAGVPCQIIDQVSEMPGPVIHSTVARDQQGMTTKCGLTRQHHTTCSGWASAVTCPECLAGMTAAATSSPTSSNPTSPS